MLLVFVNSYLLVHKGITDSDHCAFVDALEEITHVMAQANKLLHANQNHNGRDDEFYGLGKF